MRQQSKTDFFSCQLPDMDFTVNSMAEARVLVPWEHHKYPNETVQYASGTYCS